MPYEGEVRKILFSGEGGVLPSAYYRYILLVLHLIVALFIRVTLSNNCNNLRFSKLGKPRSAIKSLQEQVQFSIFVILNYVDSLYYGSC